MAPACSAGLFRANSSLSWHHQKPKPTSPKEIMRTQPLTSESLNTKLLLKTLVAFKKGDFSARLPGDWTGEAGKIADTFNDIIELSDRTARELERVSRVVGKEGKIIHRAAVPRAAGSWLRLVDSTNLLIDDMARPTSEMARVIGAVANGD